MTGEAFPRRNGDAYGLRAEDWNILREVCDNDPALFDLQVALLGVERQFRGMSRRAGIYDALEDRLRTGLYKNVEEAVEVLSERRQRREQVAQSGPFRVALPLADSSPAEEGE